MSKTYRRRLEDEEMRKWLRGRIRAQSTRQFLHMAFNSENAQGFRQDAVHRAPAN